METDVCMPSQYEFVTRYGIWVQHYMNLFVYEKLYRDLHVSLFLPNRDRVSVKSSAVISHNSFYYAIVI